VNTRELYEQARDAISLHDYDAARICTDKLGKLLPEHRGVLTLSGTVAMKRGRFAEAADTFEKILEKNPEDIEALNNLGVALKSTGDIDSALKYLWKAYGAMPERADICYNIANCLKQKGELDQAIIYYRKAIEINPHFSFAFNNLGTIYQSQGEIDRAVNTYMEGLAHDSNHPTIRYNLGLAMESQGDIEAAIKEYRRSLKSRPGWLAGMNNLGVSLQKSGKPEEAERVFRDLLRIAPEDPKGNNNLGTVLAQLGNNAEAETYYRKALTVDRTYAKAASNLSDLKNSTVSSEEAIRAIAEIAAEFPDEPGVQYKLIHALIEDGKVHQAGALLVPILKTHPESGEAHCLMGRIRKHQGKKDLAEHHFRLALEKNPESAEPWLHLAYLARDAGEIEKAMGAVGKFIEARGDSREGSLLLADLLIRKNLYGEALEMYQDLYEDTPGDKRILNGLINVNRLMGNQAEAVRYARELVQAGKGTDETEDLEDFEKTLDLYDRMAGEYSEEREHAWKKNLLALTEEEQHIPETEESGEVEEESLIDETIPDFGLEEVPIIDIGGIEPVIAVDEEEEELDLRELEEDIFLPEERDEERDDDQEPSVVVASATVPSAASGRGGDSGTDAAAPAAPAPAGGAAPAPPAPAQAPPQAPPAAYPPASIITRIQVPSLQGAVPVKIRPSRHVREQVEEIEELEPADEPELEPEKPGVSAKPAHLLAYLEDLTRYLPEKERDSFESSDMPLRMESLRAKLEGRKGLIRRFSESGRDEPVQAADEPLQRNKVKESFSFFDQLASFLPDNEVKISLKQRLGRILKHMDGGTE
jgi:tetratricopeptide (TPR) repeat protein